MRRRLTRPTMFLLLIAIVATVIVVTTAGAKSGSPKAAHLAHAKAPRATSKKLLADFRVLRSGGAAHGASASTVYQPLPQAVVEGMDRAQPEMEPSSAAFAGGTYPTWVVPGTNHVCLVLGTTGANSVPSSSCGTTTWADQNGLVIATEDDAGTPVIVGLVPNGNSTVKVTDANGATESASVTNNIYEVKGGSPRAISFKDGSGGETTQPVATPSAPPPSTPSN